MSSPTASQFVFFTCQPGAEQPLKAELAASQPEWRLAFSRPGFVSFKCGDNVGAILASRQPTFARTLSISLGRVSNSSLTAAAHEVWQIEGVAALVASQESIVLQVWQRDSLLPGENGFEPTLTPLAEEVRQALLAAARESDALTDGHLIDAKVAPTDSVVLDVVMVEPNEWYIGWHRALARHQRWPGGMLPIAAPDDMVSRAYLKMEEALKWSGLPAVRGDVWVELGCAPGGASQALLNRGFQVIGVDPAEVDELVAGNPRFVHMRKRSNEVRRVEYAPAKWLAADLNVAPQYTLDAVEDVVAHPSTSIRGLVLTLKLADWSVASPELLTQYIERVRSWGFRDIRLRQLVHNRQELCLVALHSRGQRRMKRSRRRPTKGAPDDSPSGPPEVRFDAPTKMVPPHHLR
ncbi:SAM-dependent methyltransferase [Aeoliella mucimassa]|uniref:Putative 23S rRNA ribose 2'-O-ribose methyltransferase n=1 Tax=Aeoliella mucimassa TaxID=2527972 RepID=A0A518ALJ9_9BACT|nr:SAM-dependent methyltransferase [Aeoliella mucimassa]QDU55576.1 putative 23S rRNA ribose 2'-O-ribose methyltransferase [Aeoliella mucimassa]